MRNGLLTFCCLFCALVGVGQKHYGIQQDYYLYQQGGNSLVPSVYYQAKTGWYGQLRYNYEEYETLSVQGGKTFSGGQSVQWSVTPLAGLLAGRFTGGSVGVQTEVEKGPFWLYSEPLYCFGAGGPEQNFFYNWTELCVQPARWAYTGLALQQTIVRGHRFFTEPGFVAGFVFKSLEVPLYFFVPKGSAAYVVAGVHWKLEK